MTTITAAPERGRFRTGLKVQLRVIHALMIREAMGQHGHEVFGFFWVFAEPMFLLAGIMVLWSVAHVSHNAEVEVVPFALSGYSFLTLWRHVSGPFVRIMRRKRGLRFHRHIRIFDSLVAKAALETLGLFSTFIVLYFPLYLLDLCPPLRDPLVLVLGFAMTGWFSFGVGLILAGLSELTEVVGNIVGAVMYITLPLTGAFTMQDWLPERAQKLFAWSPLVNCIEMIRGGLFPEDVPVHYDFGYLFISCCVVTAIGFHIASYGESVMQE